MGRGTVGLLTLSLLAPAVATAQSYETWRRWSKVLFAEQSYANAYMDETLDVVYTGPEGQTYQARGYWAEDDRFVIRFMFPEPGVWTWETSFSNPSDAGLHGRSGAVTVVPYSGANPLYARGGLEVGPVGRRLVHADGTPYLMVGDMAWLAYLRATDAEWLDYLDDRAARGFNAIVISVGVVDQGSENTDGLQAFPGNDGDEWNDGFWQNVDEMIQAANDRGIVIVACGLNLSNAFDTEAESLAFARNFAARVAGSHVILSPRQDWGQQGPADSDESGIVAKASAPLALITQHLSRRPMPEHGLDFHPEEYLDFSGVQTNKGEPRDEQATTYEEASRAQIEWVDALYQANPDKPILVLEGLHENEVDQTTLRREMLRRQAYLTFTSGGTGYATSAFGVWTWGQGAAFRPEWGEQSLEDGLALPYNDYMEHLADFLQEVDVASLVPYAEQEHVLNQGSSYRTTMLMAKRPDDSLAVAYLPENDEIVLDMSGFPGPMHARWYRTTTGTWSQVAQPVPNSGTHTLEKPSAWSDAVLVLELPEPGTPLGLGCGYLLLTRLARRAVRQNA